MGQCSAKCDALCMRKSVDKQVKNSETDFYGHCETITRGMSSNARRHLPSGICHPICTVPDFVTTRVFSAENYFTLTPECMAVKIYVQLFSLLPVHVSV